MLTPGSHVSARNLTLLSGTDYYFQFVLNTNFRSLDLTAKETWTLVRRHGGLALSKELASIHTAFLPSSLWRFPGVTELCEKHVYPRLFGESRLRNPLRYGDNNGGPVSSTALAEELSGQATFLIVPLSLLTTIVHKANLAVCSVK